ncbi:DUF6318 family protein [Rudaeicoccus suwonensis]|uniref:Lipoprotein n=1 Tax=Rudaeicoccus suwonensis TaxID=657409 RepID=A0A561E3V8_9MICO|nr:DUF6318 family protein [Rudaeicoccus suwonensis]TWE10305.1 hypothetical protein BKA23_2661 [Rudaeicoccus suwonensis]
MVSSRVVMAGVAIVGLVGVAGCGGSSSETAGSSVPVITAASKATSPSASASASPSSSGTAAGAPGVPEAARQHTEAGAKAFAKHYVDLINETGLRPRTGVLEPLALDSCKTCANYEGNVASLQKDGERNSAPAASFHYAARLPFESGMVIEAVVDQNAINVLNAKDVVVNKYPFEKNLGLVFYLSWTETGWKCSAIKIDQDADLT